MNLKLYKIEYTGKEKGVGIRSGNQRYEFLKGKKIPVPEKLAIELLENQPQNFKSDELDISKLKKVKNEKTDKDGEK